MNDPGLTILLPLKGRPLFTLRFLWLANRQKLPYQFIIADADPHESVKKAIDSGSFPDLDIVYRTYPPDNTFQDFYDKMASAVDLVKTPYVMQVDNDDFLIPSGLECCIDWLDKNKDYVACSGLIKPMGFKNNSDSILGDSFEFSGEHYMVCDINNESPLDRIINGKVGETSFYYSVIRTEAYTHVIKTIQSLSLTYLLFHEIFFELSLLSLGKVKINDSFCTYIRQVRSSSTGHYHLIDHFLESDIGSDSKKIKNYLIAQCKVENNEKGKKEIDAFIKNWLINVKLKGFLSASEASRKIGIVKSLSPAFVIKLLRSCYRIFSITAHKTSNFDRIPNATLEYKAIFLKEIDDIRDTLRSKELREFLTNAFNSSPEIKQLHPRNTI